MTSRLYTLSDTSPSAASTVVGSVISCLDNHDFLRVDALLVGATGGTLDVYLQRLIGPDAWADWVHFAQLAAGATPVRYSLMAHLANSATIVAPNLGTDAVPAVGLAAATFLGGHPGKQVRAVYVAGASTSAGAAVKMYFNGWGGGR